MAEFSDLSAVTVQTQRSEGRRALGDTHLHFLVVVGDVGAVDPLQLHLVRDEWPDLVFVTTQEVSHGVLTLNFSRGWIWTDGQPLSVLGVHGDGQPLVQRPKEIHEGADVTGATAGQISEPVRGCQCRIFPKSFSVAKRSKRNKTTKNNTWSRVSFNDHNLRYLFLSLQET